MPNHSYTTSEIESAFRAFTKGMTLNAKQYEIIEFWKSLSEEQQLSMVAPFPESVLQELWQLNRLRKLRERKAAQRKAHRSGLASLDGKEYSLVKSNLDMLGDLTVQMVADPAARQAAKDVFDALPQPPLFFNGCLAALRCPVHFRSFAPIWKK